MSTIASPRESSPAVAGRRIPLISTPTSSSRPSLDVPRSDYGGSPNPNTGATGTLPRRNRAALREYYNLKKAADDNKSSSGAAANNDDAASVTSSIHDSYSDVLHSELDGENFDAETYTRQVLETQSLAQLLRTYNGILTDIRALDAEKKALVYDNYSKLITATETIRKMRDSMGAGDAAMAGTLDLAVERVYERAGAIREEMRESVPEWRRKEIEVGKVEKGKMDKRRRAREVVVRVLETPERVRGLVAAGQMEDARSLWNKTLTLLERWRERGVGGEDVLDCIEDGEAALRGEEPSEKSWVNVKNDRSTES